MSTAQRVPADAGRRPWQAAAWQAADRLMHVPPLPELPPGQMIELPGRGTTYVIDTGGDRPPLMLLHALACTGLLTWYPSLEALRERYRLVIFDQRWHGRGIRSGRFHLDELADDVAAVADAVGIDRFTVAGFSLGSLVSQLVARRHADRLNGVVLAASATHFGTGARVQVGLERFAARVVGAAVGVEIAAAAIAESPFDPTLVGRWAWQQFRSTSSREIARAASIIAAFDSRPWIRRVDVPAAVVVTSRDRVINPARQWALARKLPDAEVFLAAGGHACCVIGAERFTPALVAACASVAS